jgi:hypothetical protein
MKKFNPILNLKSLIFVVIFLVTISILFLFSNELQNIDVDLTFNEENAYNHVLNQTNIGYRIPGTQASRNCTNYFLSEFQDININFNYTLHNFTVQSTSCQNALFTLNEDEENIVILGAHYDSRARATKDPDLSNRNLPIQGANDGASGCAVLLELARVFYQIKDNLSCQLWFVFFDAEDQGSDSGGYGMEGWDWCEGSQKFVSEIDTFYNSSIEHFQCMLLLDMVGGVNLQFIAEQYSTSSLLDELFDVGRQLGYSAEFPAYRSSNSIIDDHVAFLNLGIPSADLIINFWNNPSWPYHHTIKDDIASISRHSLEVTGKTIEQFIYNNYLNVSSNYYNGNFPWTSDLNSLGTEINMLIGILCAIIGISVFISYISRKEKIKTSFQKLKDKSIS